MDCIEPTVILRKQNPEGVAMDAAKSVVLMWLNTRIGTLIIQLIPVTHFKKTGEGIYVLR